MALFFVVLERNLFLRRSRKEFTKLSITESSSKSELTPRHMASKSVVFNVEYEVEKFDGTNNFGVWQYEVMDVLIQ